MTPKNILLTVGWIEGISTIFLFCVAMPLKYGFDMPQVVSLAGQIHGGLFVLLVALLFIFRSTVGHELGPDDQMPDRIGSAIRNFLPS